ncbi:MAG: hypothetical protein KDK55_04270 [Chlamydiia bacterium]|nr:hypothetical protein [Chlamydiia bacterium]
MEKLKFNLLENAFDSLNEALKKYSEESESNKHYKYSLLHLTHFLEIFLKFAIYKEQPILLYRKPYMRLHKSSQTISLIETVQVLKNLNKILPTSFYKDIQKINDLRNQIMHFEFSFEIREINNLIGRIMVAFKEFNEENQICTNLTDYIQDEQLEIFWELASDYEKKIQEAIRQSLLEANLHHDASLIIEPHTCEECGYETIIPDDKSPTGFICTRCGNIETSEELIECCQCGCSEPKSWMQSLSKDEYICSACLKP